MRHTAAPSSPLQAVGPVLISGRLSREAPDTLLARLVRTAAGLASFETVFLLFVLAGGFKGMPELRSFPIDLTLFFFILSLAMATLLCLQGKCSISGLDDAGIVIYILFLSWLSWSLAWSSFEQFNIEKMIKTIILVSWCFFGGYFIVSKEWDRVARFLVILTVVSILQVLYFCHYRFILGLVDEITGATKATNYLRYAFHGQCLVAIFAAFVVASEGIARQLLGTAAVVAVLVIMLFIGGRGPLLDALLTVPLALLFLMVNPNARHYRSRSLSVLLCLVLVLGLITLWLVWAGTGLLEQLRPEMKTVDRFETFSEREYGSSVGARIEGQHIAFERWLEAPIIGWGVGEFNRLGPDGLKYPHNLFLEILMEQGLVGFGLLATLTGLGLVRAWKIWPAGRRQWPAIAVILLFIPVLMSRALHQGFLPDERVLFVLLGLILGLGRRAVVRVGGP